MRISRLYICLSAYALFSQQALSYDVWSLSRLVVNFNKAKRNAAAIVISTFIPFSVHAVTTPTDDDNRLVQQAFRDFDLKRFKESEQEFSLSIDKWKQLDRPVDEIVSLLKARASVLLDNKRFEDSIRDCNEAIELMRMKSEPENIDGTGKYPEYVDTFVDRALAKEGLADWTGAVADYDKAVTLWGGGRGDGINPYVLTFRGNALCRLSKFSDAIPDYKAASDLFIGMRDIPRFSDARANMALAMYELGQRDESVKVMKEVIRRNPGYADMHVALAADDWANGDYINALKVSVNM